MLKKYKFSFDVWGFLLFLIIIVPNFIWFFIPAPNDILKTESITEVIDTVASVCQVLMITVLCIFRNRESKKFSINPLIIVVMICCVLYFMCWIAYYMGIMNAIIILGLIILPCLAFLFFSIDRKNRIAVILTLVFMVCHLMYGLANFII